MYRAKSKLIKSISGLVNTLEPVASNKNKIIVLTEETVFEELTYKSNPPRLENVSNINLSDLGLNGSLHPIDWEAIEQLFTSKIGMSARLSISIDYEEKEEELSNDGIESVRITKDCGKYFFGYTANGSRLCLDKKYSMEVFGNMFKVMELPIVLTKEGEEYSLTHADDYDFEASHTRPLISPASFDCELVDIDNSGLIKKLKYFVQQFVSTKITGVTWSISPSVRYDISSHETNKQVSIYNMAVDANLPTLQYDMCPGFRPENLQGLETIRILCVENNNVTIKYGGVVFEEDVRVMVSVHISSVGYYLQAGAKNKLAIDKLSSLLNIDFVDN